MGRLPIITVRSSPAAGFQCEREGGAAAATHAQTHTPSTRSTPLEYSWWQGDGREGGWKRSRGWRSFAPVCTCGASACTHNNPACMPGCIWVVYGWRHPGRMGSWLLLQVAGRKNPPPHAHAGHPHFYPPPPSSIAAQVAGWRGSQGAQAHERMHYARMRSARNVSVLTLLTPRPARNLLGAGSDFAALPPPPRPSCSAA